jgi:hypothetical protein
VDGHPGDAPRRSRDRTPSEDGGLPGRTCRGSGAGDRDAEPCGPSRPGRPQGPEASDRQLPLPRSHRRGEDGACQGARRVHVRDRRST